jgi:hypothetical protein
MKKQILTVIAALVFVCAWLAPTMLKNTGLAWINWDFPGGHDGFYFKKRQWLADFRTIVAAVRYLYESHTASSTNPLIIVHVPALLPLQNEISTNLLGTHGTESSMPLACERLSRVERMMARHRTASCHPQLPKIAEAPCSSKGDLGCDAPVWV